MVDPVSRDDGSPAAVGASHQTVRLSEQPTHERASEDYQAEIEKLRAELGRLAQSVGGTVRETMKPVARDLEAAVVRNPTASVAIAAGVGLLLGFMMSRK